MNNKAHYRFRKTYSLGIHFSDFIPTLSEFYVTTIIVSIEFTNIGQKKCTISTPCNGTCTMHNMYVKTSEIIDSYTKKK